MRVTALSGFVAAAALVGLAEDLARPRAATAARKLAPASSIVIPPSSPPAPACARLAIEPFEPMRERAVEAPIPPIEDPDHLLAPFYERVAALLRKRAKDHVRIGYYSDSNGTKDYITGEIRRRLQMRYGDAGHGFIAVGRPWNWYIHRDIKQGWPDYFDSFVVSSHPSPDPYYGHGLIFAESTLRGARQWIATAGPSSPIGRTVSRVVIYYLRRPGNKSFDVLVDGKLAATVDTNAENVGLGVHEMNLEDAPHRVDMVAGGGGPVRLLGATFERGEPSVVVDALSVGAASWRTMLREDPALDAQMLRHRRYDLMILHMGSNTWKTEPRVPEMKAVIRRLHEAMPETPILILPPPDQDYPEFPGLAGSDVIAQVAPEERVVAREMGAAYFDFHKAMGGARSMMKFWLAKMSQPDVVHFNEKGGAYMGDRVLYALWEDFAAWLRDHESAGCGALE